MSQKIDLAYFSMEFMLKTHIPTYSGGLGVLAGDLLRSCADKEIPAVGITLVYKGASFNQTIKPDGTQTFSELDWRKNDQFTKLPQHTMLVIDGKNVRVECWRYDIVGFNEYVVPVYLLDTDTFENDSWARSITDNLYAGDPNVRLCQEIVLGVGGVKILRELGIHDIKTYHMNEGHSAFATLQLLSELNYNDNLVRKKCIFTTHTPIPEGHDSFDYEIATKYAGTYLPWHIKKLAGNDKLNMSRLAMSLSKTHFAVSKKHESVTKNLFADFDIDYVTNGVHPRTWVASNMQDLYSEFIPDWLENPELLKEAPNKIPDNALWLAHLECKKVLVDFVNKHISEPKLDELFDVETLTLSLARRPVAYKRPLLIYRDFARLVRICAGRVQIVQSGKSHPDDEVSQEIVREILRISQKLKGVVRIIYLENYSPKIARILVSGADIWLNTPTRPLEASGTSGMKAAMNGVLNFSVPDGWWIEGSEMAPDAGFTIGPKSDELYPQNDDELDSEDLYQKLEGEIVPMYYEKRAEWIKRMKAAITLASYFNTHRVLDEYLQKSRGAEKSH
ncbi:alpha-glucan family phosphorylase [Candidatus Woesebacteria bacterium]|nr:alpha-glucan family phosphorylase [Candidatus Woesebacteria bacterium]